MNDELQIISKLKIVPFDKRTTSEKIKSLAIGESIQVDTFNGNPVVAVRIDDPELVRFVQIKTPEAKQRLKIIPLEFAQ